MVRTLTLAHLFDPGAVAVLTLLGGDPLRSFYQREVARLTGVSVGKVNRLLRTMEQNELAVKEERGRTHLYRYNLENPLARYIKIVKSLADLNWLVLALRKRAEKAVLFGSCADGSDTNTSDIDVFIVTRDKGQVSRMLASAAQKMKRRITPIVMTPGEAATLKSRDTALSEQVQRGIRLWQRS